jgi:DNA polymerase alpha-associated DNA helicase A
MERTLRHVRRAVLPDTSLEQAPPIAHNETLIRTLLGLAEPQWLDEVPATFTETGTQAEGSTSAVNNDIQWFGGALNDSQKEAITFCLKAQSIACIHGPPGVSPSLVT